MSIAQSKAWLSADLSATERRVWSEQRQLELQYADLYNELIDEQREAIEDKADYASAWEIGGTVLGAIAGFATGTGGVYGAAKGAQLGQQVGSAISETTYEFDDSELASLEGQIESYDWTLSDLSKKWNYIEQVNWEDEMGDMAKKHGQSYERWEEEFTDKDLVGVWMPVITTLGLQALESKKLDLLDTDKVKDIEEGVEKATDIAEASVDSRTFQMELMYNEYVDKLGDGWSIIADFNPDELTNLYNEIDAYMGITDPDVEWIDDITAGQFQELINNIVELDSKGIYYDDLYGFDYGYSRA